MDYSEPEELLLVAIARLCQLSFAPRPREKVKRSAQGVYVSNNYRQGRDD